MSEEPQEPGLSFEQALAPRLEEGGWGRTHRHFECCGSTNDEALRWIEEGAPHGALVTADRQSAGRGRLGRVWSSTEPLDLYATLIVRVRPGPEGIAALSLAVGLALVEALSELYPCLGGWALKWPNDLMLDGRKLGGVLCEARWSQGEAALAVGFGLNLGRCKFQDPELAQRATSLFLAAQQRGLALPGNLRVDTLAAVLAQMRAWMMVYLEQGFSAISEQYRRWCRELGHYITLSGPGPDKGAPGTRYLALDLDRDGALLVQRAPGMRSWRVQSDDVWLAAPGIHAEGSAGRDPY